MALLLAFTLSQTSFLGSQEPAELKLQKWLQKFAQQNSLTEDQVNAMLGHYVLGSLAMSKGGIGIVDREMYIVTSAEHWRSDRVSGCHRTWQAATDTGPFFGHATGGKKMKRILFVLTLVALSMAPASFAGCDKGLIERLNFALVNAPSKFSAIAGSPSGGTQYNLTPAGEAFCPRTYILNRYPASQTSPETWAIKFTWSRTGTLDDVTAGIIKEFNPILIAKGYQDKPYVKEGVLGGYLSEWDVLAKDDDTWITVETWVDFMKPTEIGFVMKWA